MPGHLEAAEHPMSLALATLEVVSVRHWVTEEPQITSPLKKILTQISFVLPVIH